MKLTLKLLSLVFIFMFSACDSSDNISAPQFASEFQQLDILLREHGYSNLITTVVTSDTQFDTFMTDVKGQENWNTKEEFLAVFDTTTVDFKTQNLIFYRITESSGSVTLTPQAPIKDVDNLLVTVTRDVPDMGTDDMSYNCLAYVVDKNITAIVFQVGTKKETILNSTQEEKPAVCTMQYAPVCASKEVQCITAPCNPIAKTYSNTCVMNVDEADYLFDGECPNGTIPKNCTSWYDGCNTCSKNANGDITCTKRYCELPDAPFECLSTI